jgi:soluble lytic murein transglycosylase
MLRRGVFVVLLVWPALACNLPLLAVPTATLSPTATSTVTPTPSATPTPMPEQRFAEAEWSLFVGDWDVAMREYQDVLAAAGDEVLQGAAQLGIGDTWLRQRRYAEAEQALTAFLDGYPGHPEAARALLLRGRAWQALGRADLAASDFQSYLTLQPDRLGAYVEEWLGDALRQAGRPLEAVPHYLSAVGQPRISSSSPILLKVGLAYLEGGQPASALLQMDQLYATDLEPGIRASANWIAGRALEALGDWPSAQARYLDSVTNFPEAYDSYQGLVRLVEGGGQVDDFQRGLVDYYAEAYGPALAAFDRHLQTTPTAAGYFYRGLTNLALDLPLAALGDFDLLVERFPHGPLWTDGMLQKARVEWAWLDRYSAAIETYTRLVADQPDSPRAPEALMAAGRTAERVGELGRAAELWLRLPSEYPASPLAQAGAFQAGVARFRAGDFGGAREAFALAQSLGDEPGERAAALLWEGKAHLAEGQAGLAVQAWEAARQADPTGYYSERADDLLNDREPFADSQSFDFSSDLETERAAAESWLSERFGLAVDGSLQVPDTALVQDRRMIRGLELWRLGLFDLARDELEALRLAVADDPRATYQLMHVFLELGLYRSAILEARQILALAGMDDAATMGAPRYFNRIRFGPYFGDLILPEAARQGFDGLFLLSVVRQESLFEGFATSYAAARGLMQVIPSTGQSIADELGWPSGYETEDLYRPVVSVRFGTHYLAAQRARFEGDLYAALAAYNAGPGNAILWKELAPDDPDLFLEVIRLDQPQLYIRTIFEVHAIYRRLYAGG